MASTLQIQGRDTVYQIGEYPAINAIQNFSWDPRFNEEYMIEMGNIAQSGKSIAPEISGSFDLNATGSTVAMLRRMIMNFTAGEFAGYKAGDPAAANPNLGTIKTTDLENAVFDIIEKKAPNQAFSRATLLGRVHLSSINIKCDANNNAEETYNFEGDVVRIFPTGKHDLVTVPVSRAGGTETIKQTGFTVDLTTWDLISTDGTTQTWQVAFFMIDEVIVPLANVAVTTPGTPTGAFTITGGFLALAGQRLSLVLWKTAPGVMPTITYPTTARFIKSTEIDIFMVPVSEVNIAGLGNTALNAQAFLGTDRILRAQSIDVTVDLRREALRQIAKNNTTSPVYYRGATYPLNITATINVLETTMQDFARLQNHVEATDILDLDSFDGVVWQLVIRYYKAGATLQTTALLDAQVTGSGHRISASGRGEISWGFTASSIVIEGT